MWPPDDVLDRIEALPRPDVAGLRWTRRDQWHVTLRFLGSVTDAGPVHDALAAVAASAVATEAVLGPTVDRFGRRVLQVPVSGLEPLAAAVVAATSGMGHPPDDRPFAGHVTLARVSGRGSLDLRPLTGAAVSARWPVGEMSLMRSRLSPAGARYEVVTAFGLSGGTAP